jgi:hypothetical protein
MTERNTDESGQEEQEEREEADPSPPLCDICGAPMLDRHCKLLCLRCGYQRDCSDP